MCSSRIFTPMKLQITETSFFCYQLISVEKAHALIAHIPQHCMNTELANSTAQEELHTFPQILLRQQLNSAK